MLQELYIKDFGIFAESRIRFSVGMTVLTGETGAGKSLIVDAINLILGSRASLEDIRSGADESVVEAVFEVSKHSKLCEVIESAGYQLENGLLFIRRLLQREGRGRVFVNNQSSTVGFLATISPFLVDLSGQHEQQVLLDVAQHILILDQFGNYADDLKSYQDYYKQLKDLTSEKRRLEQLKNNADERRDFLEFRIRELKQANLQSDEEEELINKRQKIQNFELLYELVNRSLNALYEEEQAIVDQISIVERDIQKAAERDSELNKVVEELDSAMAITSDVANTLSDYRDRLTFDPSERDQVEERLMVLSEVKRKYGSVEEAIAQQHSMQTELAQIENVAGDLVEVNKQLNNTQGSLVLAGKKLRQQRQKAATRIGKKIGQEIKSVGMDGAQFIVDITPLTRGENQHDSMQLDDQTIGVLGLDQVQFLFSANPGEPAKPLTKVASGGELSRVLLAVKLVLFGGEADTLIFDEIDSGIGGKQAELLGLKMAELADHVKCETRQVLCVTHLAPIASFADHHFVVQKSQENQRTVAKIHLLDNAMQYQEVARMLAGVEVTKNSVAHAQEMLTQAREKRANNVVHQ